jgi:hypothetical protein
MQLFRTRQHGGFHYATTQKEYGTWSNCTMSTETETASFNWVKVGQKKTFSDVVTKDFRKLSAQGKIIMSPMMSTTTSSVHDAGTGSTRVKPNFINCGGVLRTQVLRNLYWTGTHYYTLDGNGIVAPTANLISSEEVSDLVLEYSTKVLANRCRPDNNLFETLAELDKSVALLPNLLKGIKGRIPKGKRALIEGTLASAWLSYRYGVMPLIRDTYAIVEGLKKTTGRIRETTRANSPRLFRTTTGVKFGTGSTINHTFGEQHTHEVSIRCMSLDEYERSTAHAIGFDFSKLLTTPWELLPYSFVIDWFANVGDFINAAIPQFRCRQLGSCVTVNEERAFTLTHLTDIPVNGYQVTVPSHGSYRSSVVTRRRIVGPLQSGILVKNDFRFNAMTRVMDALSLLLVRLRA